METWKTETWRTAEGDEIPVEKMTDSHLRNAYRFVGRRLESNLYKDDPITHVFDVIPFIPDTDADGTAEFAAEVSSLRRQADADKAWIAQFQKEAARRGLELS